MCFATPRGIDIGRHVRMNRVVTGIQPSGTPHLGNYLGMIQPALELARDAAAIYFVADYHALTTVLDPAALRALTFEVTATWLALGLDPESILYLQSDLPEVCELSWLLGCVLAKGLLNRGHAYKSLVDENRRAGRPEDSGVTAGVFNYPLLMAADILIHDADVVPVGEDNRQHIEITRDIAVAFNGHYGEVFTVPEGRIEDRVAVVPGTDGRKMSKSYGNVVPIFGDRDEVVRRIKGIVTDSRRPEEPKEPESCNVFALYRLVATEDAVTELAERYRSGAVGYREAKELLIEAHELRFGQARERFRVVREDQAYLRTLLTDGAERARGESRLRLDDARAAVGIIERTSRRSVKA
jgi:tryptophanyl-tRNA synthetase